MKQHWRIGFVAGLAMLSTESLAGGRVVELRKQVEASMLVTGHVEIDTAGRVVSHGIDQAERVPQAVRDLLAGAVPQWVFEPVRVEGQAVRARSPMRVRVVARMLDGDQYSIAFREAQFPGDPAAPGTEFTGRKMVQPRYPESAVSAGVSASVFVAVKLAPDGTVEDAAAEQVNLGFVSNEPMMVAARKLFASAAVKAAKASTFNPPVAGEDVGKSGSVRVPYLFVMGNDQKRLDPGYGQWAAYVPGPYEPAPWRVGEMTGSPDMLSMGDKPQPLDGAGLKLLTRIDGS